MGHADAIEWDKNISFSHMSSLQDTTEAAELYGASDSAAVENLHIAIVQGSL